MVNVQSDGHGHFYDDSLHNILDSTKNSDAKYGLKVNMLVKASEDKSVGDMEESAEKAIKAEDQKLLLAEAPGSKKPKNEKEKFDAEFKELGESLDLGAGYSAKVLDVAAKAGAKGEDAEDSSDDAPKKPKPKPADVAGAIEQKADDKLLQKIWAQMGQKKPETKADTPAKQREITPDDADHVNVYEGNSHNTEGDSQYTADDVSDNGEKAKELSMEAKILNKLSVKLGKGDSHKGAMLLSRLLSSDTNEPPQARPFKEEGGTRKGVLPRSGLLLKVEEKILERLASKLGHGNGRTGALVLSQLLEEEEEEYVRPSSFREEGASRKDVVLPEPSWYTLSNFVREIKSGKLIRQLVPTHGMAATANWQEEVDPDTPSWFPISLFKGTDNNNNNNLKVPFSPLSVSRDGFLTVEPRLATTSSGDKKSGPSSSLPTVQNPHGGMVFLSHGSSAERGGPYLVDHWGRAVDLSKRNLPGYIIPSKSGGKSYLYVPVSALLGNKSADGEVNTWSNETQVVLTPKGPMTLNPSGCSGGVDGDASDERPTEYGGVAEGKRRSYISTSHANNNRGLNKNNQQRQSTKKQDIGSRYPSRDKRQVHVHVSHSHESFGVLEQPHHPHFASDDFLNGSYVAAITC